jgi:hypothetical protein
VLKTLRDVQVGDVIKGLGSARKVQDGYEGVTGVKVKEKSLRGPYLTWVRLVVEGGGVIEGRLEDTVVVEGE